VSHTEHWWRCSKYFLPQIPTTRRIKLLIRYNYSSISIVQIPHGLEPDSIVSNNQQHSLVLTHTHNCMYMVFVGLRMGETTLYWCKIGAWNSVFNLTQCMCKWQSGVLSICACDGWPCSIEVHQPIESHYMTRSCLFLYTCWKKNNCKYRNVSESICMVFVL